MRIGEADDKEPDSLAAGDREILEAYFSEELKRRASEPEAGPSRGEGVEIK